MDRGEADFGGGGGEAGRPAEGTSATETGWPVRKQSTQGPWSVCSWNSSSNRVRSEEAATSCNVSCPSVSSSPAAETPSNWTHLSVNTCRNSITSKSSTSVSAISTNTSAK